VLSSGENYTLFNGTNGAGVNPQNLNYTIGSSFSYECHEGLVKINGTDTRNCTVDRTWSGGMPTCGSEYNPNVKKTNRYPCEINFQIKSKPMKPVYAVTT